MIGLIGSSKGGSTKSTTIQNLAVELASNGIDVMLLDADPQQTSSKWVGRRNEAGILPKIHCTQKTGDIYDTAIDLNRRYGIVLIDAGGYDSRELRTGMLAANVLIITMQASQPDLETMPEMMEIIDFAKDMNPDLQVKAVLTRVPTNRLNTEAMDAREALEQFNEIGLLRSVIRERKVYREANRLGKGVVEMDDPKAKAEIQLLAAELWG